MEYGRWALTIPGWLFAPLFALLVASAIWRIGRERLVNYEENPMSRGIHVAYEWAYVRILRHKVAFTRGDRVAGDRRISAGRGLADVELAVAKVVCRRWRRSRGYDVWITR